MSRRLLQTRGGKGLYLNTDPAVGSWTEWLPLPPSDNSDPAARLLGEQAPPTPGLTGGLWGDPNANRDRDRRRKADAALEAHGIRPAPWV